MNRRDRRRARSMKEFIRSGEANRPGTPEEEAEVERDSKLALELEKYLRGALLPWLAKHPLVDWTCTVPALLRIAAMDVMAGTPETTPGDFGAMAAEFAKTVQPIAAEVSKRAKEVMAGPAKKVVDEIVALAAEAAERESAETLVDKQVRLVLEKQTRDIAEKLKAWCPAGVGFILFLADYGAKGNIAYVSSCDREDAIKMVMEWLGRQRLGGTGDDGGSDRGAHGRGSS